MPRLLCAFLLLLAVAACVGPPRGRIPPAKPVASADAELKQCLIDLDRLNARYVVLPDRNAGGGCTVASAIRPTSLWVPVTNIVAIRCILARNVALWMRDAVQPAARRWFGSQVVRLETMGSYSCRNVIGRPQAAGQRSEHATGNAIDIAAFVLADGRRVAVNAGWQGREEERAFLRAVRDAGCRRFQTVLSPDFNAAHADHLHFDMGRGPFCR